MAYLLDTNVVSVLRRQRPHGAVLAWLQSVEDADLHLACVTIGEIQAGIERTREQDPEKADGGDKRRGRPAKASQAGETGGQLSEQMRLGL